jgi:hypothetical protein
MVSCLTIALILFVLEISQEVTSAIFRQSHYTGDKVWTDSAFKPEYWANVTAQAIGYSDPDIPASHHATVMLGVSEFLGLLSMLCVCAIVCTVRAAVRRRDNIPSNCCGAAEDCCCAFCCNPCTQCMLLRHEKESSPIGNDDYSVCHPTALPL